MAQGEQTGDENTPGEFSGEPNELPGEPIPGTDQVLVDLDNRVLWPLQLRPWRLHYSLFNLQPKHTPKPWHNNDQK